jgi:hypothetical protein
MCRFPEIGPGCGAAGRSKADCGIAGGHATAGLPAHGKGSQVLVCVWAAGGQQPVSVTTGEPTWKPWRILTADTAIDGY